MRLERPISAVEKPISHDARRELRSMADRIERARKVLEVAEQVPVDVDTAWLLSIIGRALKELSA